MKALIYLTVWLLWLNGSAIIDAEQIITLTPADNGVGIFTTIENDEAFFTAQRDYRASGVYKAIIDGEDQLFVRVSDDLYQAVDEITVTKDTIETIINQYYLQTPISNDLREVRFRASVLLPKKMSDGTLAHYEYDGHMLTKTLCLTRPSLYPLPYYVSTDKATRMMEKINKVVFDFIHTARVGLLPAEIIIHITSNDRIDVTLEEYKTRTYISVLENDGYIPRLKCDSARWRFTMKKIKNDLSFKKDLTHTEYRYQNSDLTLEQMNEYAIARFGKRGMYKDVILYYPWEDTTLGEKKKFLASLPV